MTWANLQIEILADIVDYQAIQVDDAFDAYSKWIAQAESERAGNAANMQAKRDFATPTERAAVIEYVRKNKHSRTARGICRDCPNPRGNRVRCEACREKRRRSAASGLPAQRRTA